MTEAMRWLCGSKHPKSTGFVSSVANMMRAVRNENTTEGNTDLEATTTTARSILKPNALFDMIIMILSKID